MRKGVRLQRTRPCTFSTVSVNQKIIGSDRTSRCWVHTLSQVCKKCGEETKSYSVVFWHPSYIWKAPRFKRRNFFWLVHNPRRLLSITQRNLRRPGCKKEEGRRYLQQFFSPGEKCSSFDFLRNCVYCSASYVEICDLV